MENFEPIEEPKVREKNIYLLHLDKARIAILSSIIIGIIAISFLIGMKLTKTDKTDKDLFTTNNFNTTPMNTTTDINDLFEQKPAENAIQPDGTTVAVNNMNTAATEEIPVKKAANDVLVADNINVVSPVKTNSDTVTVKSVAPKSTAKNTNKQAAVNNKTAVAKNTAVVSKEIKPKNVAVSAKIINQKAVNTVTYQEKVTGGFSVQVASYDNYARAKQECDLLKNERFKTYIDDASVNGTNYYRVRIGPFSERLDASTILDRLQQNNKYIESYIIKE